MLSLLLSDNLRSKIYIDIFKKNEIFFEYVFFYNYKKKLIIPFVIKFTILKRKKLIKI